MPRLVLLPLMCAAAFAADFDWKPYHFPPPVVPADNPMSAAKVELGRHLFYDKRMSLNGRESCASCHRQELAFTDGRARAEGTTGQLHARSSMSLVNVAYTPLLTWANPELKSLEEQALIPMFGENPIELGMKAREGAYLEVLRSDPVYVALFSKAYLDQRPPGAEEVTIHGEDVELRGWYFKRSGPRRGTVVYLHGSADNRVSGISVAERFVNRGFDALIYDSRAHGESGGAACTYGYYEKKDLSDAIDSIRHKPVIVLGVSPGAAVALQAAADDRRIAAVIAVATFCDLRTVATGRAPFLATKGEIQSAFHLAEERGQFKVDDVSPAASASRVRVPVFLVHGQADRDTPPWHSERVFAALAGPRKLLIVPGAGHSDALRAEVWEQVDAWIDDIMPTITGSQK